MDFESDTAFRLRALGYPLQGVPERFLVQNVDRIFNVIDAPTSQWRETEYLAAVREGLASADDLAKLMLLDDDCSDKAVREFLQAAEQRIAARIDEAATPSTS